MSNLVAGMCRGKGGGVGCLGERNGSLTGRVSSRWSRLLLKPLKREEKRSLFKTIVTCPLRHSHSNTTVSTSIRGRNRLAFLT